MTQCQIKFRKSVWSKTTPAYIHCTYTLKFLLLKELDLSKNRGFLLLTVSSVLGEKFFFVFVFFLPVIYHNSMWQNSLLVLNLPGQQCYITVTHVNLQLLHCSLILIATVLMKKDEQTQLNHRSPPIFVLFVVQRVPYDSSPKNYNTGFTPIWFCLGFFRSKWLILVFSSHALCHVK